MPREIIKSRAVNCWNRKAVRLNKFFCFSFNFSAARYRLNGRKAEEMGFDLLLRHFTRSQEKGFS